MSYLENYQEASIWAPSNLHNTPTREKIVPQNKHVKLQRKNVQLQIGNKGNNAKQSLKMNAQFKENPRGASTTSIQGIKVQPKPQASFKFIVIHKPQCRLCEAKNRLKTLHDGTNPPTLHFSNSSLQVCNSALLARSEILNCGTHSLRGVRASLHFRRAMNAI